MWRYNIIHIMFFFIFHFFPLIKNVCAMVFLKIMKICGKLFSRNIFEDLKTKLISLIWDYFLLTQSYYSWRMFIEMMDDQNLKKFLSLGVQWEILMKLQMFYKRLERSQNIHSKFWKILQNTLATQRYISKLVSFFKKWSKKHQEKILRIHFFFVDEKS